MLYYISRSVYTRSVSVCVCERNGERSDEKGGGEEEVDKIEVSCMA